MAVARAVLCGQLDAVETRTMFEWAAADGVVDDTLMDALSVKLTALYSVLRLGISSHWSAYRIDFYVRDGESWVFKGSRTPVDIDGTSQTDFNQFQSTMNVFGRTGVKRAIPRKYLPGLIDVNIVNGFIIPAMINSLLDFAAKWLAPVVVGALTWYPGIVSKNSAFAPLLDTAVTNVAGTWRKRKPGAGI